VGGGVIAISSLLQETTKIEATVKAITEKRIKGNFFIL
jgi:hypothetical protein